MLILTPVIKHGRIFGQDRDSALALEIVRVHHAVHMGLVGAEGAALLQHRVNQRGLAMIHVGDDRNIPNT